jgi:sugar phosphate isomerase/epimerase
MLSRRTALLAPLAAPLAGLAPRLDAAPGKMGLSIHMTTSQGAGYQKALEGWAKAGIKYVEVTDRGLNDFLKTNDLAAAKRVITDNGLTLVSCASVLQDFWNQNAGFPMQLETWKTRCEQFAAIGSPRIYCPSTTSRRVTAEDYKTVPDAIHQAGDVAKEHNLIAMIEFARSSTLIATLTTALKVIREANHPNVRPMLDCYHFWSGLSKFEDLDMLKPGELSHVHFQDTPDIPKELFAQNTRLIPGDGIAPLERILRKLAEKGYDGALSVELFLPELQNGDPQQVGTQIRTKCEAVMTKAGVL